MLQQETIEGHAVRATLLCAGLVAAANVNGREDYLTAAQRLWDNMVQRRMYVIGGLGAVAGHEGFGPDYVLPNNGYLETCAAIGAGFFHHNMNLALADARYADELERVLYNGVLPGVSLQGDTYFYENPLEAGPKRTRWAWHGCPCCPPMFLKIMGALPGYIYAQDAGADLRQPVHWQPCERDCQWRHGRAPADDPHIRGMARSGFGRAGAGNGVCHQRAPARLVR